MIPYNPLIPWALRARPRLFYAFTTMALTASDVQRIAKLARLRVAPDQAPVVLDQLNAVFDLIQQLESAPTAGVEPMTHPYAITLRLRADEVTETNQREHFQSVAPAVERGLYLVPKVIE